jgi:hypothetical protein
VLNLLTNGYSNDVSSQLRAFQVKWTRFTVQKASVRKTRADSVRMETALAKLKPAICSDPDASDLETLCCFSHPQS